MPVAVRAEPMARGRGFAAWRVLVWLLLLLAAFGCVQYVNHAQLLWTQWHALAPDAPANAVLRGMFAWDIAYLLAALVLIVLCAGCILRQAWSRQALRVVVVMLALWMLVSLAILLMQWPGFERASTEAMGHLDGDVALQQALRHARDTYLLALVLKALAVPVLLWLSWRLGMPSVRAQFRPRR
ncbi:MAG: hypothetical protein ABI386_05250 [Rhodanobacter sp.]